MLRIRRSWTVAVCALAVVAVAAATAAPAAAAGKGGPHIKVLSNRADLISAGDALIRVTAPPSRSDHKVRVFLRGTRVKGLARTKKGGRKGLVKGLRDGRNKLVARAGKRSSKVVITNHPNGGPVFSGPQVQPWKCQETAVDAQCNQPPTYEFIYKPEDGGAFSAYDPDNPPSDVATTKTDRGVEVPFIVRIETGYQARDQYKIAVLYDPAKPWSATKPQPQFNHKLLITHGASCGVTYESGEAPNVTADTVAAEGVNVSGSSPELALGRGFAVMSTALNNAGHNCNIVTQAESLVMAKERVVERYGKLRYTIGTGCSGGSLTQQQVANAYPGIYQGILPQCSYPDAISTGIQFLDYSLLRTYFEDAVARLPQLWNPVQYGLVEGHITHVNAVAADEAFFNTAVSPTGDCVPEDVVYDPETNPGGVRCSILDYMINVFGPRPQEVWSPQEQAAGRGFGGIPIGNVGVQYGLDALEAGQITPEQFVDLNHQVGGLDINMNPIPQRLEGDRTAIRNAYRSGAINSANHLDKVAIIDLRGPDPGIAHDAYRSWELRARLDREHGTHANQVIWFGPAPLVGDLGYTSEALLAMDDWLEAVVADRSSKPLAQRIIANKPEGLRDKCDPDGAIPEGQCDAITAPHRYGTPRTVAGDAITTDNAACELKALDRSAYGGVTFTDEQWQRLQEAFPSGVCDFSRPGIEQQATIAWQRYQERGGAVIYGGEAMGRAPGRSGTGWAAPAFKSWLSGA